MKRFIKYIYYKWKNRNRAAIFFFIVLVIILLIMFTNDASIYNYIALITVYLAVILTFDTEIYYRWKYRSINKVELDNFEAIKSFIDGKFYNDVRAYRKKKVIVFNKSDLLSLSTTRLEENTLIVESDFWKERDYRYCILIFNSDIKGIEFRGSTNDNSYEQTPYYTTFIFYSFFVNFDSFNLSNSEIILAENGSFLFLNNMSMKGCNISSDSTIDLFLYNTHIKSSSFLCNNLMINKLIKSTFENSTMVYYFKRKKDCLSLSDFNFGDTFLNQEMTEDVYAINKTSYLYLKHKHMMIYSLFDFFLHPGKTLKKALIVCLLFVFIYMGVGIIPSGALEPTYYWIHIPKHYTELVNIDFHATAESLIRSVYFSFCTFTTVGYGDYTINNSNPLFMLIPVIQMTLGYIFSGVIIGSIFNRYLGK